VILSVAQAPPVVSASGIVVDLAFPISGKAAPADHVYALYSALSETVSSLHGADWMGVHTIVGKRAGDQSIVLTDYSRITLRLPLERLPEVLPLAGKTLNLIGYKLVAGNPTVQPLTPAKVLRAWCVVIKKGGDGDFREPGAFLVAAQKQLNELGIAGTANLETAGPESKYAFKEHYLRIQNGEGAGGFGLYVFGLSPEHSLLLQQKGIGGRRRMGCGLFLPAGESR
jgi:CRISPR-associated protein Cas6